MRWAEGGSGVRRAREPEVVVIRIGDGEVVLGRGGRRVRVEG